jgi:hypothetical protein
MEFTIFPTPEVARELSKYVEVRLHTDLQTEPSRRFHALKKQLAGTEANPVYVVVDPGKPDSPIAKFEGADLSGKRFREFLAENAAWHKNG